MGGRRKDINDCRTERELFSYSRDYSRDGAGSRECLNGTLIQPLNKIIKLIRLFIKLRVSVFKPQLL